MKNKGLYLGIFVSILLVSFVSAAGVADAFKPIVEMISGFFGAIFKALEPLIFALLGTNTTDEGLFIGKLLVAVIVFSIAFIAVEKMGFFPNNWSRWVVALAVSLLGVRYLNADFINTIILSNSAFAVAVSAGIPFVLYFYLVKDWEPSVLRRVAWIFFAVVFLGLYGVKSVGLQGATDAAYWIYPSTALLAIVMAWFDGTIHKFLAKIATEKTVVGLNSRLAISVQKQMTDITSTYEGNPTGYVGVIPNGGAGKTGERAYEGDLKVLKARLAKYTK